MRQTDDTFIKGDGAVKRKDKWMSYCHKDGIPGKGSLFTETSKQEWSMKVRCFGNSLQTPFKRGIRFLDLAVKISVYGGYIFI